MNEEVVSPPLPLTTLERQERLDLEQKFEGTRERFLEGCEILAEIDEKRLWREDYESFKSYCRDGLKLTPNYVKRLISSAKTAKALCAHGHTPTSERQIRSLGRLPKKKKVEAFEMATDRAKSEGLEQPTSAHVEQAAQEIAPTKAPESKPKRKPEPEDPEEMVNHHDLLFFSLQTVWNAYVEWFNAGKVGANPMSPANFSLLVKISKEIGHPVHPKAQEAADKEQGAHSCAATEQCALWEEEFGDFDDACKDKEARAREIATLKAVAGRSIVGPMPTVGSAKPDPVPVLRMMQDIVNALDTWVENRTSAYSSGPGLSMASKAEISKAKTVLLKFV